MPYSLRLVQRSFMVIDVPVVRGRAGLDRSYATCTYRTNADPNYLNVNNRDAARKK
jgi:hypothetical protein